MKKINKILVPVLACGALAATTPALAMLTSCKNNNIDKTLAGYTVDQDTYRIYGLNKKGQRFGLTDNQIEALAGGFLLVKADGTYLYVDEDGLGADGATYPNSIKGFMERASEKSAFYYEIWLCGGNYNLETIDSAKQSHIKFDIKGIINNQGEITSSVNILPAGADPEQESKITGEVNVGDFRDLNFSTVNIKGAMKTIQAADWTVKGADSMSFTYCHFYGLSMLTADYLDLYGCTLDSSCIKPLTVIEGTSKTQYSLWVKDVDFASFSFCNFISDGKAVKLHPTGLVSTRYIFNGCDFQIDEIPHEVPGSASDDQDKFAVDTSNKTMWTAAAGIKMVVYWNNITGEVGDGTGAHTWDKHYGKIGSVDKSQWDPETYPERQEIIEGKLPA